MKNTALGLLSAIVLSSCSVQQFAVNTTVAPFQNGGRVWGERTEKCGPKGWKSETKKDKDIHVFGINVRKSNVAAMADQLHAARYTIETKSNLVVALATFGLVDYKIVKVIKREK